MDHQAIKDLLPLAALDRLESEESRVLQEHLRLRCDECEAELRDLREVAAALALNLGEEGSESRIWQHLAQRMRGEVMRPGLETHEQVDLAHLTQRAGRWRAAAGLLAAAVAGLAIYTGNISDRLHRARRENRQMVAQMNSRIAQLRTELVQSQGETGALQRLLDERIRLEKVLTAPDLRLTQLTPLTPAPGARAFVAVSAATNTAVLQAAGLPATPPDNTYELWWITRESGPVAAGLFQAQTGRSVIARVSTPPSGQHVLLSAVTLEAAGGVNKPSGAMYLKGAPGAA